MKRIPFQYPLILCLALALGYQNSNAQLLSKIPGLDPKDPIEKNKNKSLNNVFNDVRFDVGYFLYLENFVDLNIVALENKRAPIYKPEISKRLLFYFLDNLADVNELVIQDYFDRGLARIDSGKYDLAMNDFDKALIYDPENADAYLNRGVLFIYSNQYPEALEELEKAEKYDSKNAGIFFNRGLIYYTQGNYSEAINQLNQCIHLDDQYARAYYERGLVNEALGKNDEALKDYRKARNLGVSEASESIRKIKDKMP